MKKVVQLLLAVSLVILTGRAFAVTSSELFNDGKRAFSMGNFTEAEEIFTNFTEVWPDSSLAKRVDYYLTICKARNFDTKLRCYSDALRKSLEDSRQNLEKDFSPAELAEVKLAILHADKAGNPFTWAELKNTANSDLLRILENNWYTDPAMDPMKTLDFVNQWEESQLRDSSPELKAHLSYVKGLALWQLLLSPLSLSANARILKTWGVWPVHTALDKALKTGFEFGNKEIKKQIALLGFHFDYFRHKGVLQEKETSDLKSRWLTYLSERGINFQEAGCPR